MNYEDEAVRRAMEIAARIKPLLAGHGPELQGAALVELVAMHVAGHPAEARERVLALHIDSVRKMVPVIAYELFGEPDHPGDRRQ